MTLKPTYSVKRTISGCTNSTQLLLQGVIPELISATETVASLTRLGRAEDGIGGSVGGVGFFSSSFVASTTVLSQSLVIRGLWGALMIPFSASDATDIIPSLPFGDRTVRPTLSLRQPQLQERTRETACHCCAYHRGPFTPNQILTGIPGGFE